MELSQAEMKAYNTSLALFQDDDMRGSREK